MAWDLIFWIFSFIITLALLASSLNQGGLHVLFTELLSLSDLETYAHNRINYIVVPDFLLQGILCVLFLATRHWVMFLLTLPLTASNFILYMNERQHTYFTEFERHYKNMQMYRVVKLGVYLILFTVVMFSIHTLPMPCLVTAECFGFASFFSRYWPNVAALVEKRELGKGMNIDVILSDDDENGVEIVK